WQVPLCSVDLEGDLVVCRSQSVVDEAASPVDVFDRILVNQEQRLFQPEDLGEQRREIVFRCRTRRLALAHICWHVDNLGDKSSQAEYLTPTLHTSIAARTMQYSVICRHKTTIRSVNFG